MKPKSAQLQIRVSSQEKTVIQRLAKAAGMDMSAYVLSRVLTAPAARFSELCKACASDPASYGLAELNTFLTRLSASELREAVASTPGGRLKPYIENYIAAMVEYACQKQGVPLPLWAADVEPLAEPVFASALQSLRLHLLTHSPPPFRRRNIFIDSSIGDRV